MMRKVMLVAICVAAAACSSGHSKASNRGSPTTGSLATPLSPPPSAADRAEALCRATLQNVFSATATTVGNLRDTTTGGTRPPSQNTMYPSFDAASFAAWCWTGHGPYNVYEVTSDRNTHLIASDVTTRADQALGAPPRVP